MPDKYSLCPTGLSNRKTISFSDLTAAMLGELTQMAAKLPQAYRLE